MAIPNCSAMADVLFPSASRWSTCSSRSVNSGCGIGLDRCLATDRWRHDQIGNGNHPQARSHTKTSFLRGFSRFVVQSTMIQMSHLGQSYRSAILWEDTYGVAHAIYHNHEFRSGCQAAQNALSTARPCAAVSPRCVKFLAGGILADKAAAHADAAWTDLCSARCRPAA